MRCWMDSAFMSAISTVGLGSVGQRDKLVYDVAEQRWPVKGGQGVQKDEGMRCEGGEGLATLRGKWS